MIKNFCIYDVLRKLFNEFGIKLISMRFREEKIKLDILRKVKKVKEI